MGKYDDNYLYEKETDLLSEQSISRTGGRNSSSINVSSGATSLSSLELQLESTSRSSSRRRLSSSRGYSGRRQRRRRQSRSCTASKYDDEEIVEREKQEEVELLQEVINRRYVNDNNLNTMSRKKNCIYNIIQFKKFEIMNFLE